MKNIKQDKLDIIIELISKIVRWDKGNKKLRFSDFEFMSELTNGNRPLTERNKSFASSNLTKFKKLGFTA